MQNSNIEWTDDTFNPWIGCEKNSPGCKFCYAEAFMTRKPRWTNTWGPASTTTRLKTSAANWRKPLKWNEAAGQAGERRKVFCASLADVFEDNPLLVDWRRELLEMIVRCDNLDWLLLTKRPENVTEFIERESGINYNRWFQQNKHVAIGTSIENQAAFDKRIKALVDIPTWTNFLSVEPLLGEVDLYLNYYQIDWVIVGGESGPNARPMSEDWVRSVRNQCQQTGTAFFFKQWGGANKKAAGRILDGQEWSQMPGRVAA